MINTDDINKKAKAFQSQVDDYKTLKWNKTYRGISTMLLIGFFLVAVWSNLFLALLLVPLLWLVSKGKKGAMITSEVYLVLLTLTLIAGYIEANRNTAGDFVSSLTPIYLYVIFCGITLRYLYLASKVEKLRKIYEFPRFP